MKLALITTTLSPHQLPLAQRLVARLGEGHFRYIAVNPLDPGRVALGWSGENGARWVLQPARASEDRSEAARWAQESDVVLCGTRDVALFSRRASQGKVSLYMSERWFKPPLGMARIIHPSYSRMALEMIDLMHSPRFFYLPMGVAAASDLWRLQTAAQRLLKASLHALIEKMRLWGYFVEPAVQDVAPAAGGSLDRREAPGALGQTERSALRVLWCGRFLDWKRVDTLIRAAVRVGQAGRALSVKLVGLGPEERRLRRLASELASNGSGSTFTAGGATIVFCPPVPVAQVRVFMRTTDVYVIASNSYEGWGAVVNEAMEEGCAVVASRECGAGSALVRDGENGLKFSAGDSDGLAACLTAFADDPHLLARLAQQGQRTVRELWNPEVGAERLLAFGEAVLAGRGVPDYRDGPLRSLV